MAIVSSANGNANRHTILFMVTSFPWGLAEKRAMLITQNDNLSVNEISDARDNTERKRFDLN